MARRDENLSFQDKLKAWWETDTAKAVATIVAVLLIPASVIAWNYATTRGSDIRNQLDTGSTSADVSTEEMEENNEETPVTVETETENAETANQTATETQNVPAAPESAPAPSEPETPAPAPEVNEPEQQPVQEQEPANTSANNDTANNNTDTTDNNQPAVGGLGSVEKLPNTSSEVEYTTVKGDSIYRISMKVCGNESFYKSNLKADYLKVGQTLMVTCN